MKSIKERYFMPNYSRKDNDLKISCFVEEENSIIYTFMFEDKTNIESWKKVNEFSEKFNEISVNELAIAFTYFGKNNLRYIILNPKITTDSLAEAIKDGSKIIDCLNLFDLWPFYQSYFCSKPETHSLINIIKQIVYLEEDVPITLEDLMDTVDKRVNRSLVYNYDINNNTWCNEFKNNTLALVNYLYKSTDINNILSNYIDEIGIDYFSNNLNLALFNYVILSSNDIVSISKKYCKQYYMYLEKEVLQKENIKIIPNATIAINKLILLSSVLTEGKYLYCPMGIKQMKFILFELLVRKIIDKLATKWDYYYENYFQNIGNDLDSYIDKYVNIDIIDHNNEENVLMFYCHCIKQQIVEDRYISLYSKIHTKINNVLISRGEAQYKEKLKNGTITNKSLITINDIDVMTGIEFEGFIGKLFSKLGFSCEVTKASGDQGIDVIASKNGDKIGIQVKCYSGSVGNSAIQEVVAGKSFYKLQKAIVITNSVFTESAKLLAKSNDVVLWDRFILIEKLKNMYINEI